MFAAPFNMLRALAWAQQRLACATSRYGPAPARMGLDSLSQMLQES